ncbi:MAG: transaldolase [Planctomycetes bacterium]|nr:transaldolase [Planctomycetota bacterium]
MKATALLSIAGQSIWVDNITRSMLQTGQLKKYIDSYSVVGLTSNPTIFEKAITGSKDYDPQIRELLARGIDGEKLFFELAIADLTKAADLFKPTFDRTGGVDGWVSLEVSPLLARDAKTTIEQAVMLHGKANRPNLYIKVPGTTEGLVAIEELIYRGVPINVTLLFSPKQYLAAANAYLKGIERRLKEGKSLSVESVASLFVSRWDKKTAPALPEALKNTAGIAVSQVSYKEYCELYSSERFLKLQAAGARPQRLLFASTSTKDPKLADIMYVKALAAARSVNTMPEGTLNDFFDHGTLDGLLRPDGGTGPTTVAALEKAGCSIDKNGAELQVEGADSFNKSWNDLLAQIHSKSAAMAH